MTPVATGDFAAAPESRPHLERGLGVRSATTANMLAMIGVGPFITIPLLLGTMRGPQAMLGWIVGAGIAISDGLVWAELGAAIPESGGGYNYLRESYGRDGLGRLMSFLFLWQTMIIYPLTLASGAVGFSKYATYLYPAMTPVQAIALAMGVCLVSTVLIYRRIDRVGRWGIVFGCIILVAVLWIVGDGIMFGRVGRLAWPAGAFRSSPRDFWIGLGGATLYAMYDYGGYQTVCFLGGEVVRPERTIPRAIVFAIVAVATMYLAMNFGILSVMPWQEAMRSRYIVSDFIASLHGRTAASVMTSLILITTVAGVFAGLLAASRIPYAAAADGRFYRVFARVHRTGHFPSFSVLYMGIASAVCCLFTLDALISAGTVIYVMVQSLPMVAAVAVFRRTRPDITRPFRVWLYPAPLVVAFAGWTYIVVTSGLTYILVGFGVLGAGVAAYLARARQAAEWPWA